MPSKDTTLSIHQRVAHEIKGAKKTMFRRHREGQSLANAANTFLWDVQNRLHKVIHPDGPARRAKSDSDTDVRFETEVFDEVQEQAMRAIMTLLDSRGIPTCIKRALADALEETAKIAGVNQRTIWTTNPGPGLKVNSKILWEVFETPTVREMWDVPSERDVINETDEQRAKAEAQLVARFLQGGPPDFLMEAMLAALDRAWEHVFGQPHDPYEDYTAENLEPLFLKTKLISWDEMWPDDDEQDDAQKGPESVTATLPDGQEVELYGDAVDMVREETQDGVDQKVLQAISELLHNPLTPQDLFEKVAEFTCEQSNRAGEEVYHSPVVLGAVLASVQPDDLRSATLAARSESENQEAQS